MYPSRWAFHRAGSSSTAPRVATVSNAGASLSLSSAAADLLPPPRRLRRSYRRRGAKGRVSSILLRCSLSSNDDTAPVTLVPSAHSAWTVPKTPPALVARGDLPRAADWAVDVEARDVDVGAGDVPRGAPVGKLGRLGGRDARSGDGGG